MRAGGRDRRRKGRVNRLRRLVYAVLLWLSAPLVAHAVPAEGKSAGSGPTLHKALLTIESFPESDGGTQYRVSFNVPDSRIAAPFARLAEGLRTQTWSFNDRLPSLRGGVGLDLQLRDAGNLHLRLFPDEDHPERGRRWTITTRAQSRHAPVWSVGGSVDLVRTQHIRYGQWPDSEREVRLAPELMLDVDRLAGIPGTAQLTLQHGGWRDRTSRRYAEGDCWQVQVRWRF